MTENAVRGCDQMINRIYLPDRHNAVVAHCATTRNTRMIEVAIQRQIEKTGLFVAVIAFDDRRQMKF